MARELNIAAQALELRRRYPTSSVTLRQQRLTWTHVAQPTEWCRQYTVRLDADPHGWPTVWVLAPDLEPDSQGRLPHVYPDGSLCLATPGQWRRDMLFTSTFVAWTFEWLIYYEIWSATGLWHGDGADNLDEKARNRILHHYDVPARAAVASAIQLPPARSPAARRRR